MIINTDRINPMNAGYQAAGVLPSKVGRLSDISLRYLACLYDPRGTLEPPNVPTNTQLSLKVKSFGRGSFSTGTSGYGYIDVYPFRMLANDLTFAVTSQNSSVGGASTALNSFSNLVNLGANNSPYATAAYGNGVTQLGWKLAGCAVYVKYAGTELNRGGDMLLVEQPNHISLSAASYNNCMAFDMVKRVPISTEWQHICFTPANDSEVEFTTASTPSSASFSTDCLAVIVNSAGASQPFDYEVYAWFEVVGTSARGATISFDDPIGYSAVSGATNQFQQLDSVLGADGLIRAVETQLNNMSGVALQATHQQNWVGLTSFLPQIASVAQKALGGALNGALGSFGYTKQPQVRLAPPRPPPPPSARKPSTKQSAPQKKKK